MARPRVLISDAMSSEASAVFESRGLEVVQSAKLSAAELADIIGEFDGLAVRSATKVTPELLSKATRLKVVGRAGIGVDNINIASCTERGIVVMNTPFGNAITTAEHALAMIFALSRHIPQANASTHAGRWEKAKYMGSEISGKLLGIIGAGNIGSIVAQKAIGIGMRVQAYDPFLSEERADALGGVVVVHEGERETSRTQLIKRKLAGHVAVARKNASRTQVDELYLDRVQRSSRDAGHKPRDAR